MARTLYKRQYIGILKGPYCRATQLYVRSFDHGSSGLKCSKLTCVEASFEVKFIYAGLVCGTPFGALTFSIAPCRQFWRSFGWYAWTSKVPKTVALIPQTDGLAGLGALEKKGSRKDSEVEDMKSPVEAPAPARALF